MTPLPLIAELIRRTKALAALDLILSSDWQYRYYSFNSVWSSAEQMASMRNGSGDEWWLIFHTDGWAALKGIAPDSVASSSAGSSLSTAIRAAVPSALADFANDRALRWDDTGFAYFLLPSSQRWHRVNDDTPFSALDAGESELLRHLSGTPADYVAFAENYYEKPVPIAVVTDVFQLAPITSQIVSALNADLKLEDIAEELHNEIGYPSGG
jgi:hypothetical protein